MIGTPAYMSPEQARGLIDLDARSDVYSLGRVLFEILTRARPWPGATRPSEVDADIPPELDELCARALLEDRRLRLASARELARGVQDFLDGDRDLEQRRKKASEHAERARHEARVALGSGPDAENARSRALREIGRALALDASSNAMQTLVELISRPSHVAKLDPSEAVRTMADAQEGRQLLRFGSFAYATFALVSLFLLLHVREPAFIVLITCLVALSAVMLLWLSRGPFVVRTAASAASVAFLSIAFAATIYGPLVLVPSLAAAQTIALCSVPMGRVRWLSIAIGAACVAVPLLFEVTGIITPSYVFSPEVWTIRSRAIWFEKHSVLLGAGLANIAAVVIPALIVKRLVDNNLQLRETLDRQAWHLRHLLPSEAERAIADVR